MIELTLTHEAEQYGRRKKRRRDGDGLKDAFETNGKDKRWTGLAAEYVLHQYLQEQGIPHRWHDDATGSEPDFELGDFNGATLGVAVKANNGMPRDDFTFLVPIRHAGQLSDGVLLLIVNTPTSRVWIAGYIAADDLKRVARRIHKGDESFIPGKPFEAPAWTVKANQLGDAQRLFDLLRRK